MARGDLIDVGYGQMASPRTMCKSGFVWRYANTSQEAINTNSDIIEIFPYILRTATNYTPYSNDLRNSYVQITIGSTTTTQNLKSKYNFGNVSPINTKFYLTSEYNSSNPFGYGTPDSTTYVTTRTIDSKTAYGARFTVPHNADGTAPTVSVKWHMTNSSSHSDIEKVESLTLDTIPRTSKPTCSNVTLGSSVTINTNRASTSFTHTINIKVGGTTRETFTNVGASQSWSPSYNTYLPIISGTSATATIECITYSGSTNIGTASTTCVITVPDNVNTKPTASISIAKGDNVVPASWGVYVKGKSKLAVTITGTPKAGTSIASYSSTANGSTYTTSTYTTAELTGSGSVTGFVKDARGFQSANATPVSYTVVDYSNPQITTSTVARCNSSGTLSDEGTYVKYSFVGSISSVSNNNAKTFTLKYKEKSASSWTTIATWTSAYTLNQVDVVYGSGGIDITKEYVFRFEATDSFTTTAKEVEVGTVADIFNFNKSGKSLAIGGVSQRGDSEKVLDVYLDVCNVANKLRAGTQQFLKQSGSTGSVTTKRYIKICNIKLASHYQGRFLFFRMYVGAGNNGNTTQNAFIDLTLQSGWSGSKDGRFGGYWELHQCGTTFTTANFEVICIANNTNTDYDLWLAVTKDYCVVNYDYSVDSSVTIIGYSTVQDTAPTGTTCDIAGDYVSRSRTADSATSAGSATNATNNSSSENLITTYSRAGTNAASSFDDVSGKFKRSGLYTESIGGTWYNIINVRHRNGESDGTSYGMQIRSAMQGNSPLTNAIQFRNNVGTNSWTGWRTVLTNDYIGCAMLRTTSDYTYSATAWANTQVAFSGRSSFTNSNSTIFEQSGNGIKCKFAGWVQVTGVMTVSNTNQFDATVLNGSTQKIEAIGTAGRQVTVSGIIQVASNDILYLAFNSSNTSGTMYHNTSFTVVRVS